MSRFARLLIAAAAIAGTATAVAAEPGQKIFTASFAPRPVAQVEVGDFHFTPGQPAPIHTHAAPVIGYVSQGTIYYQIEGRKPRLLRTGDAFYEPVGPRILHFDNASKTAPAVFTDFNLEQPGEPFIVFPEPPTAKIDRRAFATTTLDGPVVDHADGYAATLAGGATVPAVAGRLPVFGYVVAGAVTLRGPDGTATTVAAGRTFTRAPGVALANASATATARLVTFVLGGPDR